jgi:hypothetical protein
MHILGRWDDIEHLMLRKLDMPVQVGAIGPDICDMISFMQTNGKTVSVKDVQHGILRHVDPEQDCHAAFGAYFISRFGMNDSDEPLDEPLNYKDREAFAQLPLFTGDSKMVESRVTYSQYLTAMGKALGGN